MLEHYFGAHGGAFERTGDDEIVANVQGSWASYELRAVWRVEDRVLKFLALPDIRVPSDKRIAIYETIGLINEQLWLGHFERWSSAGLRTEGGRSGNECVSWCRSRWSPCY